MTRALQQRIARPEKIRTRKERPTALVGLCPLPEEDPSDATIDQWLASGAAHIGFGGHAVIYDGGRGKLTLDEWQAKFAVVH